MGSYSTVPACEVESVANIRFLCCEYAEPKAHWGSISMHHCVEEKLFMTSCQLIVARADSNSARVEMDAIFLKAGDEASYENGTTTEWINTNRNCERHKGFVAARRAGECD